MTVMIKRGKSARLTLTIDDATGSLNSHSITFGIPVMVDMPFDLVVDTLCLNLKKAAMAALGQQSDAEGQTS